MKAAVRTSYGPPDVVRVLDVDKPTAKGDQVLVKVHATTVNRTDCALRAAKPFLIRFLTGLIGPRVTVLGGEFAGVVEAVGSGVTSFKVGERVFGYSEGSWGAHAEYLSMPADGPLPAMPANVTFEEVAPEYRGFAVRPLVDPRGKDPGWAGCPRLWGDGAIGSAAVQVLKSLGAKVTAVCDTDTVELDSLGEGEPPGPGPGRGVHYSKRGAARVFDRIGQVRVAWSEQMGPDAGPKVPDERSGIGA